MCMEYTEMIIKDHNYQVIAMFSPKKVSKI